MRNPRKSSRSLSLSDSVCVIGLGRFGSSLALELMEDGLDVLGIDLSDNPVQALDGQLTHVVRADSTREEVLRRLSVDEFSTVVVAIGGHVEASILTTSLLIKFGVPNIWAKAVSAPHAEILRQLGVRHVVSPESDMGRRVAHLLQGVLEDFVEVGDDFVLTQQTPPNFAVGVPISELRLRHRHGVFITAVKHLGGKWEIALPEMELAATDHVLVAGTRRDAEAFARLGRDIHNEAGPFTQPISRGE